MENANELIIFLFFFFALKPIIFQICSDEIQPGQLKGEY